MILFSCAILIVAMAVVKIQKECEVLVEVRGRIEKVKSVYIEALRTNEDGTEVKDTHEYHLVLLMLSNVPY